MNVVGSASGGMISLPRSRSWIVSSIRAHARAASRSVLTEIVRLCCRPAYRKNSLALPVFGLKLCDAIVFDASEDWGLHRPILFPRQAPPVSDPFHVSNLGRKKGLRRED